MIRRSLDVPRQITKGTRKDLDLRFRLELQVGCEECLEMKGFESAGKKPVLLGEVLGGFAISDSDCFDKFHRKFQPTPCRNEFCATATSVQGTRVAYPSIRPFLVRFQ